MEPALLKIGEIKPVVAGYVRDSLSLLSGGDFTNDEAIHDIRLNMKKARAALKLAADHLSRHDYDLNLDAFRKTGRILSQLRDTLVYRKTIKEFVRDYPEIFSKLDGNERISSLLEKDLKPATDPGDMDQAFIRATDILRKASFRLRFLRVTDPDKRFTFDDIDKSYILVQSVYLTCRSSSDRNEIHLFRKKVKDLLYQLLFVRSLNPVKMRSLTRRLDRLASNLGKYNDLTQLAIYIDSDPSGDEHMPVLSELIIRIREKQDRYLLRIWPSAFRIFRPGLKLCDLVAS